MKTKILTGLISIIVVFSSLSQQLAFPTAEGYGKYSKGGRGGAVYEVTNLNATGAGSLGAAIAASGPRTVVFRVSGTIDSDFKIDNDYITIAGQTAPGDGITIKGSLSISANHVIIRYIRVRDEASGDALGGRYQNNIILDHVSASWSNDEVLSLYHNENVTIQWCMITEACEKTGEGHRFGGIWGNNYGTSHHNLIAHNDNRNPRWASGCGYNDHRNNVIYNWGYGSCNGGEAHQKGDRRNPPIEHSTINMIANYYKSGPATGPKSRIADPSTRGGEADAGKWWLSDNVVEGYPLVTADNWKGFASSALYFRLSGPWNAMPINQQSAEEAYNYVLAYAGCSKPVRDTIDKRIIHEVRTGTATYGNNGIIDVPGDVGGWPALAGGTPPVDSDHDGMPDSWEKANGLDTANAADRNNADADGYTMLENYLNSLAVKDTISVTGIALIPTSDTLNKNETIRLSVIISPIDATNQMVTWSSSDTNVVTVDETGLVKGIESGTATITVTTKDGNYSATCQVEVPHVSAVKQNKPEHEIRVYPNPFTNKIFIQLEGMDNINRLEVLNINGQVVKNLNKDELNSTFVELKLDIPGNIFFIRISTDENVYIQKIIRK